MRPVPGRTSEITVTSTTVPQMWLMLPDTLWHWRELRSSLQLMALVAFASMGAGILALFCFKPQHELGVFLLYLGVMFGWGFGCAAPGRADRRTARVPDGAVLSLCGAHAPLAVLFPAPCGPSPARQPTLCALGPGRPAVSGAGYIHPGGTAQRHPAGRHGGGTGGAGPGTGEKRSARPGICWQATS